GGLPKDVFATYATNRPSAEMDGFESFSPVPANGMLTRSVVWFTWSRTQTFEKPPVCSLGSRLVAILSNATNRPSADTAGPSLNRKVTIWLPFACSPLDDTLASVVTRRAPAHSGVRKNTRSFDTTRLRLFTRGAASTARGGEMPAVSTPPPSWKARRIVSNTCRLPF